MDKFNWKKHTKLYAVLFSLAILGVSFLAGIWYGYNHRPAAEKVLNVLGQHQPKQFDEVDFNLFWEVWSKLEEKYVDKEKLKNRENLVMGAISGLVAAIKDPYTVFLPPKENHQFRQEITGSFGGIGAEIGIRKGVLTIISPLKGSPAERAGLKPGDKILKIDDKLTADLTLDEAVRLIRGPEGEEVVLTLARDSWDNAKKITIKRETIKVPTIETKILPDGIFVIRLFNFTETAMFDFRKAVQEFLQSGSTKLILDLRNNPGGFLQVAVDIASWFLPPGEVVAREQFADGSEDVYRSRGYRLLEKVPIVILVNNGSASASEILAGALRDLKGVKLIGTKTFGKGSVQELVDLPKNTALKVTIAKWLTPSGLALEGNGLEPDVVVELPEEIPKDRDPILEKGIEILKGIK